MYTVQCTVLTISDYNGTRKIVQPLSVLTLLIGILTESRLFTTVMLTKIELPLLHGC